MSSEIKPPSENAIRFSRVLNLKQLVAMGSSLSVGVGVFILLGVFTRLAGAQSLITPYLVMAVAALPIVLTYSERLAVLPGSGGAYNLARTSKQVWLVYLVGWFLLGGFVALIALLGWGVALYLDLLLTLFFDSSFNLTLIATVVIGLLAL